MATMADVSVRRLALGDVVRPTSGTVDRFGAIVFVSRHFFHDHDEGTYSAILAFCCSQFSAPAANMAAILSSSVWALLIAAAPSVAGLAWIAGFVVEDSVR